MSKEFEKALRVISKSPEERQSHEIHQLVPWLRSKAKLFKGLKADILADIIRHCHVVTKNRDDVVIRQGDVGDCFYITLTGQVTIYILNKDQLDGEEDDGDLSQIFQYTKTGQLDRGKLGYCVTSLGAGAPFGDVALTSGDSIRTASIIADQRTDLLVVDRALYNRSVKEVLAKEFLEKTTFIKSNPLFNNWPPKYRKQLAMALYKETFGYESQITRQGDRTQDMYFILRGQVEIQLDPSLHPQQFPLIFKAARENEVDKLVKKADPTVRQHKDNNLMVNLGNHGNHSKIVRRDVSRCTRLCHLGVNESVGDVELTMELPSYAQSAVCRETTDVLVLEQKHYERLFVRRHPKTIEAMRDQVAVKLASRLSMLNSKQEVPFLNFLVKMIESRHKSQTQHDREGEPTVTSAEKDFLNHKGPLIDLHGPGSVFFLIKLRERTKRRLRAKRGVVDRFPAPTTQSMPSSMLLQSANQNSGSSDTTRAPPSEARSYRTMADEAGGVAEEAESRVPDEAGPDTEGAERDEMTDRETTTLSPSSAVTFEDAAAQDIRLSTLEQRVRIWLEHDRPRWKAQVAPMRRLVIEDMECQPKPGNRIFLRRKNRPATPIVTSSTTSPTDVTSDSPRDTNPGDVNTRDNQRDNPRDSPRQTAISGDRHKMAAYQILLTH